MRWQGQDSGAFEAARLGSESLGYATEIKLLVEQRLARLTAAEVRRRD
jgi:hypothetical protein